MSNPTDGSSGAMPKGLSKGARSAIFFGVLIVVVGVFSYLSSLEAPPNMPGDAIHKLRINTSGELLGLGEGELPTVDAAGEPLKMDKKSVEKRVNATCASCHGSPEMHSLGTLEKNPCRFTPGKCLPEHHPPKETCIKCHRMGAPGSGPIANEALPPPAGRGVVDPRGSALAPRVDAGAAPATPAADAGAAAPAAVDAGG